MEPISSGQEPSKFKRILSDIVDIGLIPAVLGFLLGLVLINAAEGVRLVVLTATHVGWLIVRDAFYAPGRALVGLKLVSLTGDKVTLLQAFLRNILLMPYILIIGYIIELIAVLGVNKRLGDRIAKTQVVAA